MNRWHLNVLLLVFFSVISGALYAAEPAPAKGSGAYSWDSLQQFDGMDLSGETVVIAGPWVAPEDNYLRRVFQPFEQHTGVKLEYTGSDYFEKEILIAAEAGNLPNIAVFPQPGLAADFARLGYLSPLSDSIRQQVLDTYAAGQSWVDLATFSNKSGKIDFYGVFYRVDMKSLVWYSPQQFKKAGYRIPHSMEALVSLAERMVKEGNTPWCIGLGSGGTSGWPATDWVEDILLRIHPAEVYDQWVKHEIPFNDPRIVEAITIFGDFIKNDRYVAGGKKAVVSTNFRESVSGLFSSPPGCFMHRQASFTPAFFPEGTVVGKNVDCFYFPSYAAKKLGRPVLGAGNLVTMMKPNKATQAVFDYLLSPLAHELWMEKANFLTPHKAVNQALYASDSQRVMGQIILNATTFRFDGSDLMPGAVGAGSFWSGMLDFVSGESAESVASKIEQSWNELQ